MTCDELREAIWRADRPADLLGDGAGHLAPHLAACAECRALVERLARLEGAAKALPVPGVGDEAARARVKAAVKRAGAAGRPMVLRPVFWTAVAALLAVAVGVHFYVDARQPATVVDRLIDLQVDLASAEQQQDRQRLYENRGERLRLELDRAPLSDEDRRLARSLASDNAWLAADGGDPVARAERLSGSADRLVDRMDAAARAKDARSARRFGAHYGKLVRDGIGPNLEKGHAYVGAGAGTPGAGKVQQLARRQAERQRRLEAILEANPNATQKEIRQALEAARRQQAKPGQGGKGPVY